MRPLQPSRAQRAACSSSSAATRSAASHRVHVHSKACVALSAARRLAAGCISACASRYDVVNGSPRRTERRVRVTRRRPAWKVTTFGAHEWLRVSAVPRCKLAPRHTAPKCSSTLYSWNTFRCTQHRASRRASASARWRSASPAADGSSCAAARAIAPATRR